MAKYILKRLGYIIIVFFLLSILLFGIFKMVPGDPARLMVEGQKQSVSPEQYEMLYQQARVRLGLDKPIPVQYLSWMGNILQGDFGYSTVYRIPVKELIGPPMKNTIALNVVYYIFLFAIGIPLGIKCAVKKDTVFDTSLQVATMIGQRVMIAMALACEPSLLIADEPTTALDVTIQAQILKLMNELKKEKGTSILFITHDLGVINQMADEVAVMYCGQVVEMCKARTIFAKETTCSHPYTEGLMTSIPRLDTPVGARLEAIPGAVPHPLNLPKGCKFAPRCKYATEKCLNEEPKLELAEDNHLIRCFYPDKEARHAK